MLIGCAASPRTISALEMQQEFCLKVGRFPIVMLITAGPRIWFFASCQSVYHDMAWDI